METVLQTLRNVTETLLDYDEDGSIDLESTEIDVHEYERDVKELTHRCQQISSWRQVYIDSQQANQQQYCYSRLLAHEVAHVLTYQKIK